MDVAVADSRSKGAVLWLALVLVMLGCGWEYWGNRVRVGEVVVRSDGRGELGNEIDVNRADWSSLARLPGIGEVRAKAIVSYREEVRRSKGGEMMVFRRSDDLDGVKGIGPRTVEQIEPYLTFGGQ